MKQRFHLAVLGGAAWLVRSSEREEWLAEWRAELAYVPLARRTAFCLGAYPDAFWLRWNSRSQAAPWLESPWQCLSVLAILAALSVFFAFRLPEVRAIVTPPGSGTRDVTTLSGVPLDQYRFLAGGAGEFAFYRIMKEDQLAVALASRNLFDLLKVPLPSGTAHRPRVLVLSERAWRGRFRSDPEIVGRRLTMAGSPETVAAVIPARAWPLAPDVDAWLLVDDSRLGALAEFPRGTVLARLARPAREISAPSLAGGFDHYLCLAVAPTHPLLIFLLVMLATALILPSVSQVSLAECPRNPHCWMFLAAKVALVLPIVLFGSLDGFVLIAKGLQAHAMIVSTVAGFRWILMDQRRRCPVCLRRLTHPASIGQASRTFLELYGTELMCARGHGLLHVPEVRTSYTSQRWLGLDSSWSSLFGEPVHHR